MFGVSNHSCAEDNLLQATLQFIYMYIRYISKRMQGEGNSHPWHENHGRKKFLITCCSAPGQHLLLLLYPLSSPALPVGPKIITSDRNSLTEKSKSCIAIVIKSIMKYNLQQPTFQEELSLPAFCSRFHMGDGWWFWIIRFCLCFVLANNRLADTSESTCCCFRESERDAIAVLSDLNNITSSLWWSG